MIYFFVFRGTKSIGKIVWFTAIFPYVMLTALLIRGCTLTGAMEGIEYFLGLNGKGDWSKLKDIQVWVNATSQIFNSIGIGFGSLITFSSFNRQNKTILRDTLFIATVNRWAPTGITGETSVARTPNEFFFQFHVADVRFYHFLSAWTYFRDGWSRYYRISNPRTWAGFCCISTSTIGNDATCTMVNHVLFLSLCFGHRFCFLFSRMLQ